MKAQLIGGGAETSPMSLNFANHEWLLWVYFVNVPFWLILGWSTLWKWRKENHRFFSGGT